MDAANVQLGIGLPNGGAHVDGAELVRLAVGAEEIGLDSVWVMDRWLRPHAPVTMPGVPVPITLPPEGYTSVFDPIDVLAFVAARTSRVRLGTSAVNVLYHPPVLLARRFATLDRLSGGRVLAGVTSGWMAEEFAAAGVPPARKGSGLDEHLAAMRAIWGPDPVCHDSPRYPVPTSDIGPKPERGSVPLLLGYTTEAGLRRAARIADGLHPYREDVDQLAADLHLWRVAVEAEGRDPTALPVVLRATARFHDGDALFSGGPSGWAKDLATVARLGVGHVVLQPESGTDVDATLAAFAALRRG
ncbi:TIGR03619 family F420-dependent LLM class oxidoreductase [Pseudonocardia sp. TRM90224]|uniref:TIGR03619 family F420-dependent LLM class oxidoreductase n=1 Tax=Pseudonocardia sp. TRM90224 TaxID=2812678 RepID=UPI001E51A44B|nr:TIGR03619 family F420-dependent LLM class oxidoreductase [Pseudonocardia sp. TRM90224]